MANFTRTVTLGLLVGMASALTACDHDGGGYYSPGWGWDHGGWHHGSPYYPTYPGHPGYGHPGDGHHGSFPGGHPGEHPGGGHEGGGHPGGGHAGGGHEGGGHAGGGHPGGGHHMELASSAADMATDFGIRSESALALLQATNGQIDDQQISKLGLEGSDLMALAQLQMPSHDGIQKVAKALNEDPEKIEQIANSFVTDVKTQLENESSEYWQACIGSGHWSTPQNSNCKKTYWNGCVPSTGATSCKTAE